jgi:N utilization substance protein B
MNAPTTQPEHASPAPARRITRRELRRLALQALYMLDLGGTLDAPTLARNLREAHQGQDPAAPELTPPSVEDADTLDRLFLAAATLACAAWADRERLDALVREVAPQWPPHRQPAVDRAILRLAAHEVACGHAPRPVAINEAIELAKQFGGEQSPAFINGVLDKVARRVEPAATPGVSPTPGAAGPIDTPQAPEDWLRDALEGEGPGAG